MTRQTWFSFQPDSKGEATTWCYPISAIEATCYTKDGLQLFLASGASVYIECASPLKLLGDILAGRMDDVLKTGGEDVKAIRLNRPIQLPPRA